MGKTSTIGAALLLSALAIGGSSPTTSAALARGLKGPASWIALPLGTTAVIRVRDDGKPGFIVESMKPASRAPDPGFEEQVAALAHERTGADEKVFGFNGKTPAPLKKRLRLTLKRMEGKPDMLLFIENGYDQGVHFRAAITANPLGRSTSTTICPVVAGKRSLEHWSYGFAYLKVSDFVFETVDTTQPFHCR